MAENVTLAPVASFTNDSSAVATVNANNALIETAFSDCLSLTGGSPNRMQSNLDMNSNQILNLPAPATINSPARLIDVVANPNLVLTVPPVGTSGAVVGLLNGNNIFSGNNTFSNTNAFTAGQAFQNTVFINTAANSLVPGLAITQSLSGSSGFPAGNAVNLIDITADNVVLTGSTSFLSAFEVAQTVDGSLVQGGRFALSAFLELTGTCSPSNTNNNFQASYFQAFSNVNMNGTGGSPVGALFGSSGTAFLQNGATHWAEVCGQINVVGLQAGSSCANKYLLHLAYLFTDAVQGSTYDAMIGMSASAGASAGGKNGFLLGDMDGVFPLATTASIFSTTGGGTVTNGFDVSGLTITGSAFKSIGFSVNGSGAVSSTSKISSTSSSAGIGYSTGAGGVVTQATNKSTGVTLNKITGQITTSNASLAGGATVVFTFTNSAIAATDTILIQQTTGVQPYSIYPATISAGSANIAITNNGSTAGEVLVLNYTVIKGVAS